VLEAAVEEAFLFPPDGEKRRSRRRPASRMPVCVTPREAVAGRRTRCPCRTCDDREAVLGPFLVRVLSGTAMPPAARAATTCAPLPPNDGLPPPGDLTAADERSRGRRDAGLARQRARERAVEREAVMRRAREEKGGGGRQFWVGESGGTEGTVGERPCGRPPGSRRSGTGETEAAAGCRQD
jgi:hypothetical protein